VNRVASLLVRSQSGQTTAEYALVLLVAGTVVGLLAAFVRSGALNDLFQTIVGQLTERAQG
jgi:Flp pilus assembly pilin Flp